MKSIMIDMDDVIVEGGLLHLINEYSGTNYVESDFKDFYMQDIVPDKNEFFNFFITKNQYDYVHFLPDAYEVIEKLNKHYKIYIVTSYIFREIVEESGFILTQKYNYLIKNLPFLDPNNFVFTSAKSIINCDIKIDDRPSNLNNAEKKLLFTAYHNQTISDQELKSQDIMRVNDWKEVEKLLLKDLNLE